MRVFWPLRYSKKRIFSTLSKKNYVLALATNKGCPKSQFTIVITSYLIVIYMRFGSFFTFVAMGKNILFLVSGEKARIFRTLSFRQRRVFLPLMEKNNIRPLAIKIECPKSQFLRAIWAILYFFRCVVIYVLFLAQTITQIT